jgi:hypothetical protein
MEPPSLSFKIKGELTDLNAYIKALNSSRFTGNNIKQTETHRVAVEARLARLEAVKSYPVHITYHWYSKDNRMDTDNVAFAKKFINDGLVEAGILDNDGRKQVASFSDRFYIDKLNPRVEVEIYTP